MLLDPSTLKEVSRPRPSTTWRRRSWCSRRNAASQIRVPRMQPDSAPTVMRCVGGASDRRRNPSRPLTMPRTSGRRTTGFDVHTGRSFRRTHRSAIRRFVLSEHDSLARLRRLARRNEFRCAERVAFTSKSTSERETQRNCRRERNRAPPVKPCCPKSANGRRNPDTRTNAVGKPV